MVCENGQGGVCFQLRMLGKLTVVQHGRALDLPASRKVRALLAYLALTPRATSRSRLCDLLWDSTNDPRGELRWHLSKLRGSVGTWRIACNEDAVRIDLKDSFVDALEVERAAQLGIGTLASEQARALLMLFSGDFLEGLEVDGCPEFTGWLLAQRRRFRAWRVALLDHLAQSVPEAESFDYAEKWLELSPFDVRPHEHLLRALARRGRFREGEEHLEASVRLFRAEGLDSAPLRNAWRAAKLRGTRVMPRKLTRRDDALAYDHYLQGRQHLARMMQQGLEASRRSFVARHKDRRELRSGVGGSCNRRRLPRGVVRSWQMHPCSCGVCESTGARGCAAACRGSRGTRSRAIAFEAL